MRLTETTLSKFQRDNMRIIPAEILEVESSTIVIRITYPNMKQKDLRCPIDNANGLRPGMYVDYSELGKSLCKIHGLTPQEHLEEYRQRLERRKQKAGVS